MIPKGKPSKDPANYRPIALLSILYKVLDQILNNRFGKILDPLISRRQSAFRAKSSTHSQAFMLKATTEINLHRGLPTYVVNLDIKKAYDSVIRADIRRILIDKGCEQNDISLWHMMNDNPESHISLNGRIIGNFINQKGIRQGAVSSPKLFNLIPDNLD